MSRFSNLWFATRGGTKVAPSPKVQGQSLSQEMQASSFLSPYYNVSRELPLTHDIKGTVQSTGSATYGDLATVGPTVTIPVGLSGLILVSFTAWLEATSPQNAYMSVALSGANTSTAAAQETAGIYIASSLGYARFGGAFIVSDLAPGMTTVTAKYRTSSGGITASFFDRTLSVIPL